MSEIPQGLPKEITEIVTRAKRQSLAWLHSQDKERQAAAESFLGIPEAIREQLRPDSLPKILELTVGEKQYVSIRRVDLGSLRLEAATDEEDIFTAKNSVFVPSNLLQNDETIGILISPQIWCAEPKSQEIIDLLNEMEDYDDAWANSCKLQFFLQGGGRLDLAKWSFSSSPLDVAVVTMRGNKFWTPDASLPARDRQTGRSISGSRQVKPDQSGFLSLPFHSMFWSEADASAQVEVDKKFGRLYIAICGTSEKEGKREPLKKLVPQDVRLMV